MPRKGNVPKRDVLPDPVYGSKVVTKLINNLMIDEKREKHRKSFMMLLISWLKKLEKKL